jgi:hypothetical protein
MCGVRVCAIPLASRPFMNIYCGSTNVKGEFQFELAEAGRYRLTAGKEEEGYVAQIRPFYMNPDAPAPIVIVNEANARQIFNLVLEQKSGSLRGRSVDAATGQPVENVELILCHAAKPEICFNKSAKDTDGRFRVWASLVPFTLRIKAEGYEDWVGTNGTDNQAMTVEPGGVEELNVYLKRRRDSRNRPLAESEKQAGINLPAPVPVSPDEGVELDVYPRLTKLVWEPVEGAVSYSLEVDYCDSKRGECRNPQPLRLRINPPMMGITGTAYEFYFIGAQAGRWRVWAVDEEGREGFKSAWRRFVYLH